MANSYYKGFTYRIEKKISVEDNPKVKDYAKDYGLYFYIIHETTDNNRFVFISAKHYEENTWITPESFKLVKIADMGENINLTKHKNKFDNAYFVKVKDGIDKKKSTKKLVPIFLKEIVFKYNRNGEEYKAYKVHDKKLAIDNPNWYLDYIANCKSKSFRKRAIKELLCQNTYNEQIVEQTISQLFIFKRHELQKFNDHAIIMDEGKTGKSSLIGYTGEKIDNISVAGIYGSSDSKHGKFKGGLLSTTRKSIVIDEINELVEHKKGEKVLSVLNSLLENGVYNYVKQFSQKITAPNQFVFMANISDTFTFPMFLIGSFGNTQTIGRRFGIITYNDKLNGFKKGQIRPPNMTPLLNAISMCLSDYLNMFFDNKKNLVKLYSHKQYKRLNDWYKSELRKIERDIDEPNARNFVRSHKETIDRTFTRALKLWLFDNLDGLVTGDKEFNKHTIYEVLVKTEQLLKRNVLSFKNITVHVQENQTNNINAEINKDNYEQLNKSQKNLLQFINVNIDLLSTKGVDMSNLNERSLIKFEIKNYKNRGVPEKIKAFLLVYGCQMELKNNTVFFRIINKQLFIEKTDGLFDVQEVDMKGQNEETEKGIVDVLDDLGEDIT